MSKHDLLAREAEASRPRPRRLQASQERDPGHDSERATAAMAAHIGDFATYLERKFPRVLDAPVRWNQVDP